jgi:hypothetical protein
MLFWMRRLHFQLEAAKVSSVVWPLACGFPGKPKAVVVRYDFYVGSISNVCEIWWFPEHFVGSKSGRQTANFQSAVWIFSGNISCSQLTCQLMSICRLLVLPSEKNSRLMSPLEPRTRSTSPADSRTITLERHCYPSSLSWTSHTFHILRLSYVYGELQWNQLLTASGSWPPLYSSHPISILHHMFYHFPIFLRSHRQHQCWISMNIPHPSNPLAWSQSSQIDEELGLANGSEICGLAADMQAENGSKFLWGSMSFMYSW